MSTVKNSVFLNEATIIRGKANNYTPGVFYWNGEQLCRTLELPWKNNSKNVSCIPTGLYYCIKQPPKQSRPYTYFRFMRVPNREGILIHKITYVKDLRGCIGVGLILNEDAKKGTCQMLHSTSAMELLQRVLPETFLIEIKNQEVNDKTTTPQHAKPNQ